MITDVRSIIAQWPSRQEFADDTGQPVARIHKWAQNNAIPAWHQRAVLDACAAKGVPVSAEAMIAMHAANRERMKALHADPGFNPLAVLTAEQRAGYDVLKRAGYSRAEALAAIGLGPRHV